MGRLAPLPEEPTGEEQAKKKTLNLRDWLARSFGNWLRTHNQSDLRILLSVMGCPLCPAPFLSKQPQDTMKSPAAYIMQQYKATTGCQKMEGAVKSMYVSGNVRMVMAQHDPRPPNSSSSGDRHEGHFVVWQMAPSMWLLELSVSGRQIIAGSDGRVAWRHTPWLGSHAAAGGARPLRRALQGVDPATIASMFSNAQFFGEKVVEGDDCFVLKLDVDPVALSARTDGAAEMINHVMFGYFSHRSGLLVYLEDTQLEHMHSPGGEAMYWKTTVASYIGDYREVEGVKIAHSGRSVVSIGNFGSGVRAKQVSMRMEEDWMIDDVVFNVAGLSLHSFMPPTNVEMIRTGRPVQVL